MVRPHGRFAAKSVEVSPDGQHPQALARAAIAGSSIVDRPA